MANPEIDNYCPPERFRFLCDDDGHDYLIKVAEVEQFQKWLDASPYWDGYEGKDFSEDAIGCCPSLYSFTDPREDR